MQSISSNTQTTRRIIHVDMDAFYAAVEQRDNPQYRNKPLIIGGPPSSRGVVSTCSYEARSFGIHSAMASSKACRLCPHAIFIQPNFHKYKAVSRQIHAIFSSYSELIEPLALDEAFIDVSELPPRYKSATQIAKEIRMRIKQELKLTASAGVAPVKFAAKIASDIKKPDGLVIVPPHKLIDFLHSLNVHKLWGVGPATRKKLHSLNIHTVAQLANYPLEKLSSSIGSASAHMLMAQAHGIDERPVSPRRIAKSHSCEHTFHEDIMELCTIKAAIGSLAERLEQAMRREDNKGRTLTLKIRYSDFTTISRSISVELPFNDAEMMEDLAAQLLACTQAGKRPIRLLGIKLSNFHANNNKPIQLPLPLEEIQPQLAHFLQH